MCCDSVTKNKKQCLFDEFLYFYILTCIYMYIYLHIYLCQTVYIFMLQ